MAALLNNSSVLTARPLARNEGATLIEAVRAERMARRIELIQAAGGAFSVGHKFWGNQWSDHAKDLLNDPIGEPTGKIKHAVLVIGGKRFRGPSHFQAWSQFAGDKADVQWGNIQHEGFETESGHFLNREQGSHYAQAIKQVSEGYTRTKLDAQALHLQAVDGKLYTQDAVFAASYKGDSNTVVKVIIQDKRGRVLILNDSKSDWNDLPGGHAHTGEGYEDALRREVKEETGIQLGEVYLYRTKPIPPPHGGQMLIYKASVGEPDVALSEEHTQAHWVKRDDLHNFNLGRYAKDVELATSPSNSAHETAREHAKREHARAGVKALAIAEHGVADGRTGTPKGRAFVELAMLTALLSGAWMAYKEAHKSLAAASGAPLPIPESEIEAFAYSRQENLKPAVKDAVSELEVVKSEAKKSIELGAFSEPTIARRLAEKAAELEGARWERIADSEAQATYGAAGLRVLDLAGFKTVRWSQIDRPTKRHTHELNQAQGEQPLGFVFQNGQAFPGDPARGPEENMNCLCQLVGVRRKAEKVGASDTGQRRAKPGGEYGANGEWYEGGKWIANTDEAKKHKPAYKPTRRMEIEPYKWEAAPEGKISIYQQLGGIEKFDRGTGKFSFNENLTGHYATPERIANRKRKIELYNSGERWVDAPKLTKINEENVG